MKFSKISKIFKFSNFENFDFFLRFSKILKIFEIFKIFKILNIFFSAIKKYFLSRFFLTIWIMSLESQKIIWSTLRRVLTKIYTVFGKLFRNCSWFFLIFERLIPYLERFFRRNLRFLKFPQTIFGEINVRQKFDQKHFRFFFLEDESRST